MNTPEAILDGVSNQEWVGIADCYSGSKRMGRSS